MLLGAAEAVAKVQYGYVEQSAAEAKAALASKELPKSESSKAAGGGRRRPCPMPLVPPVTSARLPANSSAPGISRSPAWRSAAASLKR